MAKEQTPPSFDEPATEKMVKVRINMTTVKPDFDITLGCAGFEDLSEEEAARKPRINVAKDFNKLINSLLNPGDEIMIPESLAKQWELEEYALPSGVFGVINPSQMGIHPPRLQGDKIEEFNAQVEEFGKLVDRKIKIRVSRATIIG